jgi:hypothetical protein
MRPVSMLLTGPAVKFTKVFDAASSGFKNFVDSAVFIPSSDLFPHHGDDRLKRKANPNAKKINENIVSPSFFDIIFPSVLSLI